MDLKAITIGTFLALGTFAWGNSGTGFSQIEHKGASNEVRFTEGVGPAIDYLITNGYDPADVLSVEMVETCRESGYTALTMFEQAAMADSAVTVESGSNADFGPRIEDAYDAIAGQKDAQASRLFWYTGLETAKQEAVRSGKPILSLRLLGNLTDEYSCANSRFFRTALYANESVSEYLRQTFILHWSSERPIPVMTVDFGDGRKIRRTVTGNSAHYVLDSNGRVVDAIPGLYSPGEFLRVLSASSLAAATSASLPDAERERWLAAWHREQALSSRTAFSQFMLTLGTVRPVAPESSSAPSARLAGLQVFSKTAVEAPLVAPMSLKSIEPTSFITTDLWQFLAAQRYPVSEHRLDESSRELFRRKYGTGDSDFTNPAESRSLERAIENFERSMALDTAHNELGLHITIHDWLAAEPEMDFRQLNERVYTELFLTPATDPWLGLVPEDTFAALEGNGLVSPKDPIAQGAGLF